MVYGMHYVGGTFIYTSNPPLTQANVDIGAGNTQERFVGFAGIELTF
jgi:hypothetical protein